MEILIEKDRGYEYLVIWQGNNVTYFFEDKLYKKYKNLQNAINCKFKIMK